MSKLIAEGNGLIVMVGNKGGIVTNHQGDIRTLHPITEKDLCDIGYVGNQFIIADEGKNLYASPDGVSWGQIEDVAVDEK